MCPSRIRDLEQNYMPVHHVPRIDVAPLQCRYYGRNLLLSSVHQVSLQWYVLLAPIPNLNLNVAVALLLPSKPLAQACSKARCLCCPTTQNLHRCAQEITAPSTPSTACRNSHPVTQSAPRSCHLEVQCAVCHLSLQEHLEGC